MTEKFTDSDDLMVEDDVEETPEPEVKPAQSKAWRNIERLRERRELQKQLGDDLFEGLPDDLDEL